MMKIIPLILVVVLGSLVALAGDQGNVTPPTQVVRNLIEGVKANDLDAVLGSVDFAEASLGRHGRAAEDLVAFLRAIELEGAQFVGTSAVSTPPLQEDDVILRTPTYELRFRLELKQSHTVKQEGLFVPRDFPVEPHYVVIEVLPSE